MEQPIRVLQILIGGDYFTGIANVLNRCYHHIDRRRVRFDFCFCLDNCMRMVTDDPVYADSAFYELHACRKSGEGIAYAKLYRRLCALFGEHSYDAVHINTTAIPVTAVCVMAAKHCGIKKIISHSHNGNPFAGAGGIANRIRNYLYSGKTPLSRYIVRSCTHLFGCSSAAGEALFGASGIGSGKFTVLKNAFDTKQYRYDPAVRAAVREREKTPGETVVIGHIGRMSYAKNHTFLIDVFAQIRKQLPTAQLWLIGDGEDRGRLEAQIDALGLSGAVRLLGQQQGIGEYLQAMDVFLFPSHMEGLGIAVIEAQAADLPVYASDVLPAETHITDRIRYLPLSDGAERWAEAVCRDRAWEMPRRDTADDIRTHGYDITAASASLAEIYLQ